jgi:hypothetical protein
VIRYVSMLERVAVAATNLVERTNEVEDVETLRAELHALREARDAVRGGGASAAAEAGGAVHERLRREAAWAAGVLTELVDKGRSAQPTEEIRARLDALRAALDAPKRHGQ